MVTLLNSKPLSFVIKWFTLCTGTEGRNLKIASDHWYLKKIGNYSLDFRKKNFNQFLKFFSVKYLMVENFAIVTS